MGRGLVYDVGAVASWGGVYPGDDFGGNIIDILSIFGADPINVANGITGIGGLTNSNDLAVVLLRGAEAVSGWKSAM